MAVNTSNDDQAKQYSVASSNLGNISNVIRTSGGNINLNKTITTTTSKVNGNRVIDNYRTRSYDDKFQQMIANSQKQSILVDNSIEQSRQQYAGIYTDPGEVSYVENIGKSSNIVGSDYESSVAQGKSTAERDTVRLQQKYGEDILLPKDINPDTLRSKRINESITEDEIRSKEYKSDIKYNTPANNFKPAPKVDYTNAQRINSSYKSGDMDDGEYSNTQVQSMVDNSFSTGSGTVFNKINGTHGRWMNINTITGNGFETDIDLSNYFKGIYHSSGLWKPSEINLYKNYYRFGALNPTFSLANCKEFLFFTKTDLNIYTLDDAGNPGSMNSYLLTQPFWQEMALKYKDVIKMLQKSMDTSNNPFNFLLSNMVQSNLDMPNVSAESIDTPANMYGVNYDYRGSSEASNDSYQFSLEFRDNKYLPVYHYFMAYDDYQTIKHHGYITPWKKYIVEKILYDHFSIYKFLVDEDMETIVYYAKLYGVKPMSVPREAFSNTDFSNGLSYNIDFKAAFVRDMKPFIISDFNSISEKYFLSLPYEIDIHNVTLDRPDNRPAMGAYIEKVNYEGEGPGHYDGNNKGQVSAKYAPGGYVYKLRWRGNKKL